MLEYSKHVMLCLAAFFIGVLSATPLHAQSELTFMYGTLQSPDMNDRANTIQLDYLQELPRPFAFSLSYLNEGHLDDPEMHHRDGFSFQIWARKPVFVPWFSLAAGVGPYYWYDTQHGSSDSNDYERGLGIISSAAVKIRLPYGGLFLQGRFNWVEAIDNIDTTSFLLGVGTDFSSVESADRFLPEVSEDPGNELLVHIESFSEGSVKAIEYRRNLGILGGHLEAGATYFFTGRTILEEYRSYGAAAQLWAVNVYRQRLKFGFGVGVFFDMTDSPYDASGMASYLIAFRISNHWSLQFNHNRILPNHDYDEDVRTIAVGYSF